MRRNDYSVKRGDHWPRTPKGREFVCWSLLSPECLFSREWSLTSSVAVCPGIVVPGSLQTHRPAASRAWGLAACLWVPPWAQRLSESQTVLMCVQVPQDVLGTAQRVAGTTWHPQLSRLGRELVGAGFQAGPWGGTSGRGPLSPVEWGQSLGGCPMGLGP